MPRVTKSVTAKAKHIKFLSKLQKVTMEQEVGFYKTAKQSNINHFNMHLEIEKIEKEILDLFGLQE